MARGWTVGAIGGVAVVALGAGASTHDVRVGDVLAIGSLVGWAGYFLASKQAQPRVDALDYTAGVPIVAAICTSVVALVARASVTSSSQDDWLWFALLALLPTGAHLLINVAHRYVDVSISSVISSANPIVAVAAAYVLLGQQLTALQLAGGAVGVAAICAVASRQ